MADIRDGRRLAKLYVMLEKICYAQLLTKSNLVVYNKFHGNQSRLVEEVCSTKFANRLTDKPTRYLQY